MGTRALRSLDVRRTIRLKLKRVKKKKPSERFDTQKLECEAVKKQFH